MAIISSEAGASMSSMENKFSEEFAQLTAAFLVDADLSSLLETSNFFHITCQSDMDDRKRVREELLPHIFGGDPTAVNKFFETQGMTFATLKLLITKARFREGYQSQKIKQFICFREWRGVSPLQASALCGDMFLLDNLKKFMIEKNVDESQNLIEENKPRLKTIRQEAIQQLVEVRSRISAQKIILEAAAVVLDTYSDDQAKKDAAIHRLEEIKKTKGFQIEMSAFRVEMDLFLQDQMVAFEKGVEVLRNQMFNLSEVPKAQQQKDAAAAVDLSSAEPDIASGICSGPEASISMQGNSWSAGDRKTTAETKASSENKAITYADNAEFLAPLMNLIKAYINFHIYYPILSESNYEALNKIWEIIGECQKRLPHYFKQEFFDSKPFFPLPTFKDAPSRMPCRYSKGDLLALDDLGFSSIFSLYRGDKMTSAVRCGGGRVQLGGWQSAEAVVEYLRMDLAAVTRLYELRLAGLENIIEQLKNPNTTQTLDPDHQSKLPTNRSPDIGAGPGP